MSETIETKYQEALKKCIEDNRDKKSNFVIEDCFEKYCNELSSDIERSECLEYKFKLDLESCYGCKERKYKPDLQEFMGELVCPSCLEEFKEFRQPQDDIHALIVKRRGTERERKKLHIINIFGKRTKIYI